MAMSGVHFTHIALLCQASQVYIDGSYRMFTDRKFIASRLLVPDIFETQFNSDLGKINLKLLSYVEGGVSAVLEILVSSYGISSAYTSFNLRVVADGSIQIEPTGFVNCSCITDVRTCSIDAAFYAYNPSNGSLDLLSPLTGLRLGCSPLQSTLQSSLACWYSSDCYEKE
jgi:hypothetical protein